MARTRQNIPITEVWERDTWVNFEVAQEITDGINFGQVGDGGSNNFGLATQNHIDLRNFNEGVGGTATNCTFTASFQTLTNGGYSARWPVGQVTFSGAASGTVVSNYTQPVDLMAIGGNTNLTMALFNFPLGNIDLTNSYLDLSSDSFASEVCSLRWSESTTALSADNCALTWAYASLTGITLDAVTDVRFRIAATNACTVSMLALRLVDANWVATNMDFDNLSQEFRQGVPLTGDPAAVGTDNKVLPTLWRSAITPGIDDPRPVDVEFDVLFNTGSQTTTNNVTVYVRETTDPYAVQEDLDGLTQVALTGHSPPTFGLSLPPRNRWVSFSLHWGTAQLIQITDASGDPGYRWSTGWSLSNNTTYVLIGTVVDNTARLQIWNLDANTFAITTRVFDTMITPDLALFTRQAGRVGISAALGDGDSYIESLRPRSLVFAEYRSAPLQSLTPVSGAQLFVQNSPDTELFQTTGTVLDSGWNVIPGSPQPMITLDQQRYSPEHLDNQSTKVTFATPTNIPQGISSNYLTPVNDSVSGVTNFDALHVTLSLWIPGAALDSAAVAGDVFPSPLLYPSTLLYPVSVDQVFTLMLVGSQGNVVPLTLPELVSDQWQEVSLYQPVVSRPVYPLSGQYQLALYYSGSVPTSIWVDGVTVHEHPIRWEARSVIDDPWSSNDAPWVDMTQTVNGLRDGVRFTNMGSTLQLRGRAQQQDAAVLSQPNLIPQYGQLGRLVWPENAPIDLAVPTAALTKSHTGRTYTFNGTTSSSANNIGDWVWDFGDGTYGSGPVVTHTYPTWLPSGTYWVTLVVTDQYGQVAQTNTTVTL